VAKLIGCCVLADAASRRGSETEDAELQEEVNAIKVEKESWLSSEVSVLLNEEVESLRGEVSQAKEEVTHL
jgi:hypothetical protein